jgi:hypothetical protein
MFQVGDENMAIIKRSRQTTQMHGVLKMLQLCAVALLCVSATAAAQVRTFARQNGWSAYGGNTSEGRKVCGMSAEGGGRYLGIKYFEGDSHVTIQLSKNTWRVKRGLRVNVEMQFDRFTPWTAQAEAVHLGRDDGLQFMVGRRGIAQFTNEFVRSNTLFVRFPDEREIEDWRADLAGTPTVATAWAACIEAMAGSDSHDGDDEV